VNRKRDGAAELTTLSGPTFAVENIVWLCHAIVRCFLSKLSLAQVLPRKHTSFEPGSSVEPTNHASSLPRAASNPKAILGLRGQAIRG